MNQGFRIAGLVGALALASSGCMTPGSQYLNPPGFSSTAYQIQLERTFGYPPGTGPRTAHFASEPAARQASTAVEPAAAQTAAPEASLRR